MPSPPDGPLRCPKTGIQHRWAVPGDPSPEPPQASVFFLNGIGLDLGGFEAALAALARAPRYIYRRGCHVLLTVPGFEDHSHATQEAPLSMAEQARRVGEFLRTFHADHPAQEVVLYGFSFGSDLAVEVVDSLEGRLPLARVVLTEMNVHLQSCFITSRIQAAFAAARGRGHSRDREAYRGFVSQVVKASAEGRLSASLMEDMALYFRTIARKDWNQLARSAREASEEPEARVAKLLGLTADRPETRFDLVFSDPEDLRLFQRRLTTWGGPLGRIRVLDATTQSHFHHMNPAGVLANLEGRLPEVFRVPD